METRRDLTKKLILTSGQRYAEYFTLRLTISNVNEDVLSVLERLKLSVTELRFLSFCRALTSMPEIACFSTFIQMVATMNGDINSR